MAFNRFDKGQVLVWEFNYSDGAASGTTTTCDLSLPDNAIIEKVVIDVLTTFTSATDAATIALSTGQGAGDIFAGIAISDSTNPWDAGLHRGLPGVPALSVFHASNNPTAAQSQDLYGDSLIKLTANRKPTVVTGVTGEALTAGRMIIYIHYTIGY